MCMLFYSIVSHKTLRLSSFPSFVFFSTYAWIRPVFEFTDCLFYLGMVWKSIHQLFMCPIYGATENGGTSEKSCLLGGP
jgi:hypothetical protein